MPEKSETSVKIIASKATKASDIHTVTTILQLPPGSETDTFSELFINLMRAGAKFPGFWSGELIPLSIQESQWKIIQRFDSESHARSFQTSETRKALLADFKILSGENAVDVIDEISQSADSLVATTIVTDVRPGADEEYFAWASKIQTAQAKYPGFRGLYIQPPAPGKHPQWASTLKFDSPESLENWFASEERLSLLSEAEKFVQKTHIKKSEALFPGWIPVDEVTGQSAPGWKTACLVMLGLFPIVILELRYLTPQLSALHPVIGTFINLCGSVTFTTLVSMPYLVKKFRWWIYPKENPTATTLKGTAVMVAAFAIELLLLML